MDKASKPTAPFLLRNPALSATHVAFGFGGNIWIADRGGGALRRLTNAGQEGKPVFSPDGKYIAFIGEYGGPRGVFVMPVEGGEPRRLTHHPDDFTIIDFCLARGGDELSWTPDGERVLFSSRRTAVGSLLATQLFTVPLVGGPAIPIALVRAAEGAFSADATRIAYVPSRLMQPEWKHYRGGLATTIRIANLSDSSVAAVIPSDGANDFNPMWVGETIYFLSDRGGAVRLFAYDVVSKRVRQVVKGDGFDIKSASACVHEIIYDQFGSLHVLDLRSGSDRVLDIQPVGDFPEVRPHFRNLADIVTREGIDSVRLAPELSPEGKCAAFGVRGDIFTVPIEGGDITNLTRTPGVVERNPAWSPDGKSIAYFSDESGEYALHIREQGVLGATRKIELGQPSTLYYSPTWSPDGRKIAYTDKYLNHWYVDLQDGVPVRIDTAPELDAPFHDAYQNPGCDLPVSWSRDSRWIAYTKVLDNHLHAVFAYSIEQRRSHALTDGMADVVHAAFDKARDYLYFTGSTEIGLAREMHMSHFDRPVRRNVYALLLNKAAPMPFSSHGDEGSVPQAPGNPDRVEIDLDGIAKRIVRLTIPARNYTGLFAGQAGVLFLIEGGADQVSPLGGTREVHSVDVATGRSERIAEGVTYFKLCFSGEKMLYAKPQTDGTRQWLVASTQSPATATALKLDSMEVYVDPRVEWRHLFEQVWRIQRQFFYDPGLHGLDLEKIQQKYRPFLENIISRADLYYLFGEMLANLAVGHMRVAPLEIVRRQRPRVGLLGADYSVEQGRFRFARIYEADPWNSAIRAPLAEPGGSVEVGEYLLAVDGREVRASADLFSYFENTAGKKIVLTVGREAGGARSRQVTVTPINDEYSLRYFAWVESNRRKVDELSGGRVAYIHLPDCGRHGGYASFNRYFFAQIGKEAAVIDIRYNDGGYIPDYFIDCLKRQPSSYWHLRVGRDLPVPALGIFGPKVMLINELAVSAGDLLPWMFRREGLGPLVGKRTEGATVGNLVIAADLFDYGVLTHPNLASYSPEGEWIAENCGVSPDIEVEEDPKAAREGRDVQLERAVDVVMGLLKSSPPVPRPQRPPYPRHHHTI